MPPLDLGLCTFPKITSSTLPGMVHAPHWYDQLTLFLGKYTPWFAFDVGTGEPAMGHRGVLKQHARQSNETGTRFAHIWGGSRFDGIRCSLALLLAPAHIGALVLALTRQLKELRELADSNLAGAPTLVGEVGIPFDLHHREAYTKKKFCNVSGALDASVDALEVNSTAREAC